MMKRKTIAFLFLSLLVLGGCATVPTGPSVMVLPPPGKPFEVFQAEDVLCRQWASRQIGQSPQETMNQNTAAGAVAGAVLGAGLGAAIGSTTGDMGSGAAIGAAGGLLLGTATGAEHARVYGWEAQRRYDIAYQQCMYAKGNQIPGVMRRTPSTRRMPPPPPDSGYEPAYPDSPPPGQ